MNRSIYILLALSLLPGCSSIATQSFGDPTADLSTYQTYEIQSKSNLPAPLSRLIEQAIGENLSAAGLSESQQPDLQVNFYTVVHDEIQVTETPAPAVVTYRRGYAVWNTYETDVRQITEGTLLVDVIDTHSQQLVWEGNARGLLSRGNMARNQKKIRQAVAGMFASFPNTQG